MIRRCMLAIAIAVSLGGCAASVENGARPVASVASGGTSAAKAPSVAEATSVPGEEGQASVEEELRLVRASTETYDPFSRFNRAVYRFNARFDEAIHRPVAIAYQRVLPQPVRTGVGNFFSNLGEIANGTNHLLQARPLYGARSLGRFVINTTLGIGGLFDVAEKFRMPHAPTSFANTLGHWGAGAGPYLVLPILGPSSVRDGSGRLADFTFNRSIDLGGLYGSDNGWALATLLAVDSRARLAFRYYQSGSPFEYEMMRFLYTRMRAIEIGVEAPDGSVVSPEPVNADAAQADPSVDAALPVALPGAAP